jgi:hypothetical protein
MIRRWSLLALCAVLATCPAARAQQTGRRGALAEEPTHASYRVELLIRTGISGPEEARDHAVRAALNKAVGAVLAQTAEPEPAPDHRTLRPAPYRLTGSSRYGLPGPRLPLYRLEVELLRLRPARAAETADAIAKAIEGELAVMVEVAQAELRGRVEALDEQIEKEKANLEKLDAEFREIDVDPQEAKAVLERARALEWKVDERELEIEQMQARQKALQQAVAELAEKAKAEIGDDRVADQLVHIVKLSEQRLLRVRKLAAENQATPAEVAEAEERLARAQIDLLQRREHIRQRAGGGMLAKLQEELVRAGIETREAAGGFADLKEYRGSLQRRAEEIRKRQARRQTVGEVLQWQIRIARNNILQALENRNDLDTSLREMGKPSVSVLKVRASS